MYAGEERDETGVLPAKVISGAEDNARPLPPAPGDCGVPADNAVTMEEVAKMARGDNQLIRIDNHGQNKHFMRTVPTLLGRRSKTHARCGFGVFGESLVLIPVFFKKPLRRGAKQLWQYFLVIHNC